MNKCLRGLLGGALSLGLCLVAPIAGASFHTYQIDQIYSNADGSIQFVVLREALGYPAEYYLSGHTFTSTQAGTTQTYTFMKNLPGAPMGGYGGMMNSTAFTNVLIATAGFAALGLVTPDYVIPNGFLPLANGTINYAGVDQVSYASLPTDGASAVNRSGMVIQNVATNFAGDSASVTAAPPPNQTATAVEYYYNVWNFYFVTSFPAEIAALNGGAFGGAWKPTGETFPVWSSPSNPAVVPTCRFFSTAVFAPKSSHFYTPIASECLFLQTDPASLTVWQLETAAAFYLELTDASGNCPAGTAPLYRVVNNGMGGAPNHRFTTSRVTRDQMVMLGWSAEGNGPDIIFACVPQ
jgi:hypothetical protein